MAANLIEIYDHLTEMNIEILLLDEWNANLDKSNIENLNKIINDLSVQLCVIEVIHKYY
jgi:energy-coupling factor transporter ATP-binding protein EcfA2